VGYEYTGRLPRSAKFDNKFDSFFDTLAIYNQHRDVIRAELDRNRDGRPDVIEHILWASLIPSNLSSQELGRSESACFTSEM